MRKILPKPQDVVVKAPAHVDEKMYNEGFQRAVSGGNLTERAHLKASFREGFRAGKLYLRELRKSQGIIDFPMKGKITTKVK